MAGRKLRRLQYLHPRVRRVAMGAPFALRTGPRGIPPQPV